MSRSERLERLALICIVIVVGALAGRASFSHVVQWSMTNLPAGTPMLYGYTNAAISELIPVAALIVYRICRRHGRSTKFAVFLIIAAGALSLSAQLAVAKASPSGWVVSAAPMVAFMLLTKLVLALLAPANEPSPALAALARNAVTLKRPATSRPETPPTPNAVTTKSPEPSGVGRRSLPPSLTAKAKVAAAVEALGLDTPIAVIAAKAGVSVSTARRHLPGIDLPSVASKMSDAHARGAADLAPSAA